LYECRSEFEIRCIHYRADSSAAGIYLQMRP